MTEEEIQALTTELESTKTELEGVKAEKETLTSEKETFASDLEAKIASITELEQTVASRDSDIATLKQASAEAVADSTRREELLTNVNNNLTQAVSAYKTAVAQANPGVPGELITGDTIEVIDQSLESAKTLVAQVRTTIEAEIAAGKVPAGAPARTPPDLSALSPREKIQYAIGGKK